MKKTFIIRNEAALKALQLYVSKWSLANPVQADFSLYKKRRSNDQNSKMWAMLTDVSRQMKWYDEWLTKENWKDMFTASLKKQRAVPGVDGGFVVLGTSTRDMSTSDISDLIELMNVFASENEVVWTDES